MNLKNMKKIHADKHTTTLAHPDGHKILVAHSALNSKMRKEIEDIPHFSGGGQVDDEYDDNAVLSWGQKSEEQAQSAEPMDTRTDSEKAIQAETEQAQASPQSGAYQPDLSALQNPDIPQPQTQEMPQADMQNPDMNKLMEGYGQAMGAEASAIGAQGKAEASAADQHMKDMQKLDEETTKRMTDLVEERKRVVDDYAKGHIDPHHFWASKSTGGKIMTGIGLILGGMGAQATGGQNVVLNLIEKQIDQDIQAQVGEMNKKQNLMTALNQQFGDIKEAAMFAKIIKTDQLQTQFAKAAAQSKDPIAQARAQQAMRMIQLKMAPLQVQLAHQQAVKNGLKTGTVTPEAAAQTMVPKEMLPKTLETMGKVRSIDQSEKNSLEAFDQIASMPGKGLFSPNNARAAKQAFIGKLIKDTEGRYNYEAAQNLADALFPNKSDVGRTIPDKRMRMQELFKSLRKEHESFLQGVGLPISSPSSFTPKRN